MPYINKTCIRGEKKQKSYTALNIPIDKTFVKKPALIMGPILENTVIWWIHDWDPVFCKRCTMGPSKQLH